jgi:hypothetical protein
VLAARSAGRSQGRGALTLFAGTNLASQGGGRSFGNAGALTFSIALAARGSGVGRARGLLSGLGGEIASSGAAIGHGRGGLTLVSGLGLQSRGHAIGHGGKSPGVGITGNSLTLVLFNPPQNVLNIGFPQYGYPLADPNTGIINQTWYQFFQTIWLRTGGTIGKG